jgi:hypothetical protein
MAAPKLDYRYVPTGQGEGGWGWHLDACWAPLFDPGASRAFYADVYACIGQPKPGPEDVGVVHSFAVPGESYLWRFGDAGGDEVRGLLFDLVSSFRSVFALSDFFATALRAEGVTNVAGTLRYPPLAARPPAASSGRVVIAQRLSEEKLPLVVLQLARATPDIEFVFVSAEPPQGAYRLWLELAPRNVSFRSFPRRDDYLDYLSRAGCGFVATACDNFGVAALECLALGKPYVAPRWFAYPEFIRDPRLLYEPYAIADMQRALRYALQRSAAVASPWTLEDSVQTLARALDGSRSHSRSLEDGPTAPGP